MCIYSCQKVSSHFYVPNHQYATEKKTYLCGTNDITLTAVTSKEDMYDDKGVGEETRAVLPSSHRGARLLPSAGSLLSPTMRPVLSSPNGAERASTYVRVRGRTRAYSSLVRLRALVWEGGEGGEGGEMCVLVRMYTCV